MNLLQRRRLEDLTTSVYEKAGDNCDSHAEGYSDYEEDCQEPVKNPVGSGKWVNALEANISKSFRVDPVERETRLRLAPTSSVVRVVCIMFLLLGLLIIVWQVWQSYAEASKDFEAASEQTSEIIEARTVKEKGSKIKDNASDLQGGLGVKTSANEADMGGNQDSMQCDSSLGYAAKTQPQILFPGADGCEFVVYVSGQVQKPGVVHLVHGSRVDDAIRAAGGVKNPADLDSLNLAQVIADGQQIHVAAPGQSSSVISTNNSGTVSSLPLGANAQGQSMVNINTADSSQLQTLPGIGPALAQRILDYRQNNGPFRSLEDLEDISGIGPKLLDKLIAKCTL